MLEVRLTTPEAIAIAGMSAERWDAIQRNSMYPAAPPTRRSVQRQWDAIDLLVLSWFRGLDDAGMNIALAARLAVEMRRALHLDAEVEELHVWGRSQFERGPGNAWVAGDTPPHPDARILATIPVRQLWRDIQVALDNYRVAKVRAEEAEALETYLAAKARADATR